MSTPLSLASSKEAVSDWLQRNEFEEKTQRRLHGYNAAELFELSKRDCTSYIGARDGMRLYNLLQTVRTSEGITQEAVLAVVGRKRKDSTVRKQDDAVEYRGAEALPINRQQQGDGVCNTLAIDMAYVEDEPSTPNNSQRVNQGHGSQRGSSGRKYYASVALGSKPVSAHCAVGGCNSDAVIMCMQENCGAPVCCKHVHKDLIFSYVYCPTCWGEWWYRTIVPTRWPLFRKLFL